MASSGRLNISGVLLGGPGTNPGTLVVDAERLIWRASEGERKISVTPENLEEVAWVPTSGKCQLKVHLKNGVMHSFLNLAPESKAPLAKFFGGLGLELLPEAVATKGHNWGEVTFKGKNIQFHDSEGKVGATLPMAALTAAVQPGNNDVELQFTTDDTVNRDDEALVEMRLWIPPGHAQLAAAAAEAGPTPSGELPTPAAMLQKQVMEGAGLTSVSGEVIAEFDEKVSMFLTPRGRYAIELYGTFMRMVGKTNEFKVSYSTIARISYLRRPSPTSSSTPRYSLVISLDDPVKHGQQRYAHLVMQVDDVPHTCTVNADAETRSKKFAGIDEKVSGNLPKVMAIVLKSITGKKVYRPSKFKSALGHSCVKCALSSSDGLLYPLDKSFFFIHKPATFIRFSEVSFVEFQRTGQASVTFDIHIACKSVGSEPGRDFTFKAIDAREKEPFASFVKERGLKLIMEQAPATMASSAAAADAGADGKDPVFGDADESDSDDEDFEGGDSPSSEGESDSEDDGSGGSGGGDSDDSDASGAEGGHKRARGGEGSSPSSAKKARTDA